MEIFKKFRDILYIVIIVLLLFLFKDILVGKVIKGLGGYTDREVTIKLDSVYKKGKIDTTAVFNAYVKAKGIILNPEPKVIYKYKYIKNKENKELDSVKKFEVAIKDSLLDGTFNIYNKFNGDLADTDFNYKPLFPKYITRVDTIYKTKTIKETVSNKTLKLGIGIGINNLLTPSILGSVTTKDNWQVIYEYNTSLQDKPFIYNNTPYNDIHSLKLIKNF